MEIVQENYKNFGKCLSLNFNGIKMLVTIDIGPRIIFFGKNGKNILFEDIEDTTNKGGEFFDKNLKGEGIWHLYGGHRLWKSPEYMDTYYPDNKPVDVELGEDFVVFKSKIETTTKLQKSIIIRECDGDVKIQHIIENMGNEDSTIAAWALTVLDKKTQVEIPLSQEDTIFLPNRNVVFWPYTDIKDNRIDIQNNYIKVEQKDIVQPVKIGTYTNKTIIAKVNGQEFKLRVEKIDGSYPDYSCNVECYTNNHILEIETLSPIKTLKPSDKIIHTEIWSLK